jgi:hypothetical protein
MKMARDPRDTSLLHNLNCALNELSRYAHEEIALSEEEKELVDLKLQSMAEYLKSIKLIQNEN